LDITEHNIEKVIHSSGLLAGKRRGSAMGWSQERILGFLEDALCVSKAED